MLVRSGQLLLKWVCELRKTENENMWTVWEVGPEITKLWRNSVFKRF